MLTPAHHGHLLVVAGKKRGVLDLWLHDFGPILLQLGYSLQPCLSGGGISFCTIRKGRHKWTIVYFETMTGVSVECGLEIASVAANQHATREGSARAISIATAAVSSFMMAQFGVALNPTVGMTAMAAARSFLPHDFQKWRPTPLLNAMMRQGMGYRGGMTYAARYSGPTWRIDVNRQYTAALCAPLPLRSTFGRLRAYSDDRPGVFVCRVWLDCPFPYPLGVWEGPSRGFEYRACARGEYVAILTTAEVSALREAGARVVTSYGYVFTATFTLAEYVAKIQSVIDTFGRDSGQAKLTKPLGNYVYGKLGQRPRRTELLYSESKPDKAWYPYWDEEGTAWENVWERTVDRVTMSQHADIAGVITASARAQTVQTWALLASYGAMVVRCHTDSLTMDTDPESVLPLSATRIGEWKLEREDDYSVIVGPNAYFDQDGAHIAGVSEPTFEMIDRLLDGQVVSVTQTQKAPRRGMTRGSRTVTKELRATAQ